MGPHRRVLRLQGVPAAGARLHPARRAPGTRCRSNCGPRRGSADLSVREIPVERIYCDHDRSFGRSARRPGDALRVLHRRVEPRDWRRPHDAGARCSTRCASARIPTMSRSAWAPPSRRWCASGGRVVIVDLTNGEPTPHGTPERRAAESAEAARILGVRAADAVADQPLPVRHGRGAHRTRRGDARVPAADALRAVRRRCTPRSHRGIGDRRRGPLLREVHQDRDERASRSSPSASTATWRSTCASSPSRRSSSMSPRTCPTSSRPLAAYESQFSDNPNNAASSS